ncbi:protein DENND6B isoform X4 [Phyllopteryx taeniolatus]|uniref:protein DENND6B isoform X4 n=1 Tax=Phyllopteryx taeniolatus TaxID=161469 RepID=UPI002AD25EFA|nr:protein DENND6B isoform X4 [Phyllopteryx taeniolatus]
MNALDCEELADRRRPWARFSSWLECVCVVTFDLELGQAIELVYPPDVKLTEKEKSSLCYLSFPDSYSGSIGDTQFSFRMRQSVGRSRSRLADDVYNRDAAAALQSEASHFYGYVYFRQVKDVSVKRGYFQKSLVLVSRLPFVQLFYAVLHVIAADFFHRSEPSLETGDVTTHTHAGDHDDDDDDDDDDDENDIFLVRAVCKQMDRWPFLAPGLTLTLPLMDVVLQVRIPCQNDKAGSPARATAKENAVPTRTLLPSVHELDLFRCFQSVLIHLQMLWELALLGEPLVVMAPSPTVSSETVLALVRPNVILGVTNPFFIKTFHNWPHVLRLGETTKMLGDVPKQLKVKKVAKLKTLDTKPGVFTAYKSFLLKDKVLIKRLLKGIQRRRPSEVQSAILRRHFLELTQSFIIPLERYMASLMPLQRSVTPWKTPPQIRPFSQDEFMAVLERGGPQLTSALRGDWTGLYRKFFKSPNFDGWYRQRHREMTRKLESLHLEVICEADLLGWTRDKSEVEIVDLILKLREKLLKAGRLQLQPKDDIFNKLESLITSIVSSLPQDLHDVLNAHARTRDHSHYIRTTAGPSRPAESRPGPGRTRRTCRRPAFCSPCPTAPAVLVTSESTAALAAWPSRKNPEDPRAPTRAAPNRPPEAPRRERAPPPDTPARTHTHTHTPT